MASSKMRILHLMQFPLFGSGSGNYVRKLTEKLAQNPELMVAIACPDDRLVKGVKIYTLKPKEKCVFVSHPEYKKARRYQDLPVKDLTEIYESFLNQIIDVVEDFKPDVIHVHHCFFLAWVANYIKSMYGICYVVTAHGTGIFQATVDNRFLVLTTQALARADLILSNSNYTNRWLLKVFSYTLKRKTRIVPCGVDLQAYPRGRKINVIDKKYNLTNKNVVIFVGRLTWEKGVIYLLKAAPKIKGEVFIIGGGAEKENLERFAKINKLRNVHFLGYFGKEYVNELREFYQRADCVVLPSVCDEGLGIVILEAMASNTPVIATNKGGIPLAVKDGKTGFLVRAKSAEAISAAVNKVISDPKLMKELGWNARKLVEEKFDWLTIQSRIKDYYVTVGRNTEKLKLKKLPDNWTEEDIKREQIDLKKRIDYIP